MGNKPAKPYPDFPLTPHAKGWCKKYNGKVRMVCGPLPHDQALVAFARKLKEWGAADNPGSEPPPAPTNDVTLIALVDRFIASKEARVHAGEMTRRSLDEYDEAVRNFWTTVGGGKLVANLGPPDFQAHRTSLAKRFGVHRQKKFQIMVRSLFKWGVENDVTARLPRYGTEYDLPSKRAMRVAEAEREQTSGRLMFEPAEVGKVLTVCESANLRAMILLALNGGYGQEDLSSLPLFVIDFEAGLIEYRRTKTAVRRRMILWPETVKAIRQAIKARPSPAAPEFAQLAFLTRWGNPYVRDAQSEGEDGETTTVHKDQLGIQFVHLCRKAGVYRPGRSFYSLRRTFRTVADELGDQRAIALVMGHETGDVADLYVERVSDDRLKKVADHVRARFGKELDKRPQDAQDGKKVKPKAAATRKPRRRAAAAR